MLKNILKISFFMCLGFLHAQEAIPQDTQQAISEMSLYINHGFPEALYAVYIEDIGPNKKQIIEITKNYKNLCMKKVEKAEEQIKTFIKVGLELGEEILKGNRTSSFLAFITPFEHQAEEYVQALEKLGATMRIKKITINLENPE